MAMFEKTEAALDAVIIVDAQSNTVGVYRLVGTDQELNQCILENCKVNVIDDAFFENFNRVLKNFREKFPQVLMQKVALVLPNHLFLMDTITVPVIHRKAMQQSLKLAIESLYKNTKELEINSEILQQNRKQVTYAITGIRKDLLKRFNAIFSENKFGLQGVTFAANAMVNAAGIVNPKVKRTTCLLLDIKEKSAHFAFMVRGKTMGYYQLPFGYSLFTKDLVAAEDMLFDHASGELLVLNAKERARSKQLTLAEEIASFEDVEDEDMEETEQPGAEDNEISVPGVSRKTARKLPKFMLRPTPQSREAYVYENFRLFMKWTLELLASNPEITANGTITTVYVNIPEEYNFLFDMVNVEADENNIIFDPLVSGENNGKKLLRYLDVYGGFYIGQNNKNCTF